MPEFMLNIWNSLPEYVQIAIAVIGAIVPMAAAITAATPTKVDDAWWGKVSPYVNTVLRVLNWLALNVGKAKNADDVEKDNDGVSKNPPAST